jgi:hypothetical protein
MKKRKERREKKYADGRKVVVGEPAAKRLSVGDRSKIANTSRYPRFAAASGQQGDPDLYFRKLFQK